MSKPKQKRRSEVAVPACPHGTKKWCPWCGKPPLASFVAWAVREEGLRTFYNDKEWALSEAQVYGYGGKPIRVKVEVTEI